MKRQKIFNIILSKYFILGLQITTIIIFLFSIYRLQMLPTRTIGFISGGLVLLWLLYTAMICMGKTKNKTKRLSKRIVITKMFSIVTSIVLLVATSYVIRGNSFINNIANSTTETQVISVRVLKDSNVQQLEQLKNKPFAVTYQYDPQNLAQAIAFFENNIDSELTLQQKDSYIEVAEALYSEEVEAIVIGSEHMDILQDTYEDFKEDTVEIASYKIEREIGQRVVPTDVTQNPFTIYLTGIDTYGDVSEVARSDVNLLITVNPVDKQILMTSIPRDTEVTLASYNAMDKLTHAGVYGTEETIDTIEALLEVDIHYYARTNFTGMEAIIDQLGGVTIDSPHDDFVTLHGNYLITKGINEMDGDMALCFVRERYALRYGDFDRGRNQQLLLQAMLEKAMSPRIITNFNRLLSAVEGSFETNLTDNEIRSLINMQLDDMADWEIFSVQITGTGYHTDRTFSMWGQDAYVMEPDEDSIEAIRRLIDKVEEGRKISQRDVDKIMGEEDN